MSTATPSLVIRAGRLVCPATGLDGPGAVTVAGDRIVGVETDRPDAPAVPGARVLEFPNGIVLPGLIDLHAHTGWGGSKHDVDPDRCLLARGTTTALSQGDAGAANWPVFRDTVIDAARLRIKLAMHLALPGESAPHPSYSKLDELDVDACARAVREGGHHVWGIAVTTNYLVTGDLDPREVLARGLAAAEAVGCPILYGSRYYSDWPLDDQLDRLRPGDMLTYCYHDGPDRIVGDGRVLDCVHEARARGVLFDTGHGKNSFVYDIAEAALADGFPPDAISTDIQRRHLGACPMHDLPLVMSKLRAAGMPEADIWPRVTDGPARILGMADEIGSLAPGTCADLAVLEWAPSPEPLADCKGVTRSGGRWHARLVVRAGEVVAGSAA
ncbi:MAG: amidohydrolase family protein [Chloroflexota bacterium]|nr:amidohydrolase family protein [Chloroflexota bacterium]